MAKIIIVSYDIAFRIETKLTNLKTNFSICDETHYLKNSAAKRTKVICPIVSRCKRVLLLSGNSYIS